MLIMGVHTMGHDSSVCCVENGNLIFSLETERISRKKHDGRFITTLDFLRKEKSELLERVSFVAFSTHVNNDIAQIDNFDKFYPTINSENIFFESHTNITGRKIRCLVIAHEVCHGMVGFQYSKKSDNQVSFINEGRGHFSRNCVVRRSSEKVTVSDCNKLPWYASGMGWTSLAVMMGWKKSPSAAGKVMGMSAYGSFNESYFASIIDSPPNLYDYSIADRIKAQSDLIQRVGKNATFLKKSNLAKTFQLMFTKEVKKHVLDLTENEDVSISMSGGCALNLPTNTELFQCLGDRYSAPPICNDTGQSIGAAVFAHLQLYGGLLNSYSIYNCGDKHSVTADWLRSKGFVVEEYHSESVASALCDGEIVAWYQGKSEMGPRALGNRSILASCSHIGMKDRINHMVKSREWFRPLAAIVRIEDMQKITEDEFPSEYMLYNYIVDKNKVPEATHVDGSSRLQSVSADGNFKMHQLLTAYEKLTGLGALINTSLNGRGYPICYTPDDVVNDFLDRDVDLFVFNNFVARRKINA